MKLQNLVYVYYRTSTLAEAEKKLVGRLLLKNRQILFEYDASFIKSGVQLSPFKLPLKPGIFENNERIFEGLFGLFNDSLPDGWGRLLLDRKLMSISQNPRNITALDRLCYVGNKGMGALTYEPENPEFVVKFSTDLDEIANEIVATINHDDFYLDDLLTLGGSSSGARPKVLLHIDNHDWLVKFRSGFDPEDISAVEYAYHLMAKDAGLIVPEARVFPSKNGFGYFAVKRFDRKLDQRIHMHSIAGLLHADHREASLDYENIMKATLHLTKNAKEWEVQFRNALFNILAHNRDDHSKNFSFLMDEKGDWSVSPAYDLTFSAGPSGEHSTLVMGEGKNPTKEQLMQLAAIVDINKAKAQRIIDQVQNATNNWRKFANEAGVTKAQAQIIQEALSLVSKNF